MIKKFKALLEEGREIEFFYKGEEYFIGNYEEGRAIFKDNKMKSLYYLDDDEFIENASIDNRKFKDILENREIVINTIF